MGDKRVIPRDTWNSKVKTHFEMAQWNLSVPTNFLIMQYIYVGNDIN